MAWKPCRIGSTAGRWYWLSLAASRREGEMDAAAPSLTEGERPAPGRTLRHQLVPWFILAFLALARLLPEAVVHPLVATANGLTIVSMAAFGLGVDVCSAAKAGPRVILAVAAALTAVGLGLIRPIGIV